MFSVQMALNLKLPLLEATRIDVIIVGLLNHLQPYKKSVSLQQLANGLLFLELYSQHHNQLELSKLNYYIVDKNIVPLDLMKYVKNNPYTVMAFDYNEFNSNCTLNPYFGTWKLNYKLLNITQEAFKECVLFLISHTLGYQYVLLKQKCKTYNEYISKHKDIKKIVKLDLTKETNFSSNTSSNFDQDEKWQQALAAFNKHTDLQKVHEKTEKIAKKGWTWINNW